MPIPVRNSIHCRTCGDRIAAGYFFVDIADDSSRPFKWCEDTVSVDDFFAEFWGGNSYRFWFTHEKDASLFKVFFG